MGSPAAVGLPASVQIARFEQGILRSSARWKLRIHRQSPLNAGFRGWRVFCKENSASGI